MSIMKLCPTFIWNRRPVIRRRHRGVRFCLYLACTGALLISTMAVGFMMLYGVLFTLEIAHRDAAMQHLEEGYRPALSTSCYLALRLHRPRLPLGTDYGLKYLDENALEKVKSIAPAVEPRRLNTRRSCREKS